VSIIVAILRIRSSVIFGPNGTKLTVDVPSTWGGHIQNLKKIPSEIRAIKLSKKILRYFFLFFFFFLHTAIARVRVL